MLVTINDLQTSTSVAMSKTTFTIKQGARSLTSRPIKKEAIGTEEDVAPPSTRQTAFVVGLLWTAWLVAIIFDTLLEIENRS